MTTIYFPQTAIRHAALALLLATPLAMATPASSSADPLRLAESGQVDAAYAAAGKLPATRAGQAARLKILMLAGRYQEAQKLARRLVAARDVDADTRQVVYDWLFASDDLAEADRRSVALIRAGKAEATDFLAAGRIATERKDFPQAIALFTQAQEKARNNSEKARALRGLGLVAYQQRKWDASHDHLQHAVAADATPDTLTALAETLVRLGRTNEAAARIEEALARNPYHELANYLRGNGYAPRNYTELKQQCGAGFDAAARASREASDHFDARAFDKSRQAARRAQTHCAGYGRAFAILAKVSEAERIAVSPHRARYEKTFAATPMPVIPGIEQYVVNWNALSARHKKRVALSVEPWKAFVPILVEGGATHFIKPLHMLLSETPGSQSLRDARIDYDSRLWDDVRGAGGYVTITGIEDVERSIYGGYNTVLHEMAHQVHATLTTEQKREIQELYVRAKERDAKTGTAFLSRYAGGSVWEYFAEGANSQASPRRDEHHFAEIVRERLERIDPDLQSLIKRYFAMTDVGASLPVSLVNGAYHQLEQGRLDPALAMLDKAVAKAPADEQVLSAMLYARGLQANAPAAKELAERARRLRPDSGALRIAAADALWHSGHALPPLLPLLSEGSERLQPDERAQVDAALGNHALHLGRADEALAAFERALAYQADNPEAMWGKASALFLAGRNDDSFALYRAAVKLRTGLLPLRQDFARDLLLAGRIDEAGEQLAEARTLRPGDPQTMALDALMALQKGNAQEALATAEAALAKADWCDAAAAVRAGALAKLGRGAEAERAAAPLRARLRDGASPRYVFRPEISTWESVQRPSEHLRRVLAAAGAPGQ